MIQPMSKGGRVGDFDWSLDVGEMVWWPFAKTFILSSHHFPSWRKNDKTFVVA